MRKFVRRICLSLEAFYKGEKEHIFRKECEVGIAHRDTGKEKVWTVGRAVRDCCSKAVVEGRVSVVHWTASVSGRWCVQIVHTYHYRLEVCGWWCLYYVSGGFVLFVCVVCICV